MIGYSVKPYLTARLRAIPPGTVSGVIPTLPADFLPRGRIPCPSKRHWGTIPQCHRGLSGVVAPASASSQIGRAGRTLHAFSTHRPPGKPKSPRTAPLKKR